MRGSRSTKHDVASLSNGIVRERPKDDNNPVSIISNGVVNVSFDDIDDINMIDSGSVATVNDDDDRENETMEEDIVTFEKIVSLKRSVSFKDEQQENRSEAIVSVKEDSDKPSERSVDHRHGPRLFSCSKDCFGTNLSVENTN